jgi:predicted TIM-barrel fold metal-dependent hydrolase
MIDRYAVENRHRLGVENILFATDYPHHGCDWPHTRRVVDELFAGVPADERAKMCAGNAATLYRLG